VSALQNAIACTKLTLSTGNVSPLKKLGLLPITDSNSRCVTSWVPIQKPRVRATSWLVPVTRVNWPGLSACIGIEGLNTTGLGTAGAGWGLAGIAPRPKHDTQNQQAVTAQGIHKSPARREYPV